MNLKMNKAFSTSSLIALGLICMLSSRFTAQAYVLGEFGTPICWKTNTSATTPSALQLDDCPEGLDIKFTTELPQKLHELQSYISSFRFTVDSTKGFVVEKQVTKAGDLVDVPHANIHSCLASIGFCTPFVANTPGLATHTAALSGDLKTDGFQDFTNAVSLSAESYTIIAHGRVYVQQDDYSLIKYDAATAYLRTVLPPENHIVVPEETKTFALVAVIAASVILIAVLGGLIVKRKEKVLVYSQVEFLVFMTIAALCCSIGSLTYGYFPLVVGDNSICVLRPWLTFLPGVLMLSFLFAKTLRMFRIFNNKSLKRKYHKAGEVYLHSSSITGIFAVVIALSQLINPQSVVRDYPPNDLINFQLVCRGDNDDTWNLVVSIYIGVLLLIGNVLVRKAAKITVLFNESKYIAMGMQNLVFLALVILPTANSIQGQPGPVFLLYSLGLILVSLSVVLTLTVPKFLLIKNGVNVAVTANGTTTSMRSSSVASPGGRKLTATKGLIGSAGSPSSAVSESAISSDAVVLADVAAAKYTIKDGRLPSKLGDKLESFSDKLNGVIEMYNSGLAVTSNEIEELRQCITSTSAILQNVQFKNKDSKELDNEKTQLSSV